MKESNILFLYNSSSFLRECSQALKDICTLNITNSIDSSHIDFETIDILIADYSLINNDSNFARQITKKMPDAKVIVYLEKMSQISLDQFRSLDVQFFQAPITVKEVKRYAIKYLIQKRTIYKQNILLEKSPYEIVLTIHGLIAQVNPIAYTIGVQYDKFISEIIEKLEIDDQQIYHNAALLSHIGCVALEQDIIMNSIQDIDQNAGLKEMYWKHHELGQSMLESIPLLQKIAKIIGMQNRDYKTYTGQEDPIIATGAQMLKVAGFMNANYFKDNLNEIMYNILCKDQGIYNKKMLMAFQNYIISEDDTFITCLRLKDLEPNMILEEAIISNSGLLLMAEGLELNSMSLERLKKFANHIKEPIKVRCPMHLATEQQAITSGTKN